MIVPLSHVASMVGYTVCYILWVHDDNWWHGLKSDKKVYSAPSY